MLEKSFYKIKELLDKEKATSKIAADCLSDIHQDEVWFHYFQKPSEGNKTHNIQYVYEARYGFKKHKGYDTRVNGYELLMPKLRTTDLKNIKISSVTSNNGTYLIFSNFEINIFLGIIKATENPDYFKKYQKNSKNILLKNNETYIKGKKA